MLDFVVDAYCRCDDFLKLQRPYSHPLAALTDAQIMTIGLVAARFFGGCLEHARHYLHEHHLIPYRLSKSRLVRRLHALQPTFETFFGHVSAVADAQREAVFALDTMPFIAVQNARIARARIYRDGVYHGYNATKKTYFMGLKLHLVVNARGQPVEAALVPAALADVRGYEILPLELPEGSLLTLDKAYNALKAESKLARQGIQALPLRKKNMTTCPGAPTRLGVEAP